MLQSRFVVVVDVLQCIPVTWNELEMLHICFLAVNVLYWITLYAAATIDPGYLPRNSPAYHEAIKQVIMTCSTTILCVFLLHLTVLL